MISITSLYASLCGILILALAIRVVYLRRKNKVGIGNGGVDDLRRAVRVHANAIEYIPIVLILMAALELNGVNGWLMHVLGSLFVLSRLLHAQGLSGSPGVSFGRFWGTLVTWIVIIISVVANLVQFFAN